MAHTHQQADGEPNEARDLMDDYRNNVGTGIIDPTIEDILYCAFKALWDNIRDLFTPRQVFDILRRHFPVGRVEWVERFFLFYQGIIDNWSSIKRILIKDQQPVQTLVNTINTAWQEAGNQGAGNQRTRNQRTGNQGTGNQGTGNQGTGNQGTGDQGRNFWDWLFRNWKSILKIIFTIMSVSVSVAIMGATAPAAIASVSAAGGVSGAGASIMVAGAAVIDAAAPVVAIGVSAAAAPAVVAGVAVCAVAAGTAYGVSRFRESRN